MRSSQQQQNNNNNPNLQTRIERLKHYFKGIEFLNGIFIVKVAYSNGWNVFRNNALSIEPVPDDEIPNFYYYFSTDPSVTFNDIFDLIDETVKYNLEKEEKIELLKEKAKELEDLFVEYDLETLKTLSFVFNIASSSNNANNTSSSSKKRGRKPKKKPQQSLELATIPSQGTEGNNNNTVIQQQEAESIEPVKEVPEAKEEDDNDTGVVEVDHTSDEIYDGEEPFDYILEPKNSASGKEVESLS